MEVLLCLMLVLYNMVNIFFLGLCTICLHSVICEPIWFLDLVTSCHEGSTTLQRLRRLSQTVYVIKIQCQPISYTLEPNLEL